MELIGICLPLISPIDSVNKCGMTGIEVFYTLSLTLAALQTCVEIHVCGDSQPSVHLWLRRRDIRRDIVPVFLEHYV